MFISCVVRVRQRQSKSAAAPFEAYNSEQEVFLAHSTVRIFERAPGGIFSVRKMSASPRC